MLSKRIRLKKQELDSALKRLPCLKDGGFAGFGFTEARQSIGWENPIAQARWQPKPSWNY